MGGPLLISDDLTRTGRLARSLRPARRCTVHDLYDDIAPAELPDFIVGDVAGEDRRGYAVRYTVDVAYVDQLVTQLRTELLG